MNNTIDLKKLDSAEVIKWCRDVFGDNDIMVPYNQRRWVTFRSYLVIRDENDYCMACLKWL